MGDQNIKQDIEIAVLAKEVEHMGDSLNSFKETIKGQMATLTSVINSFIEITNKKVNRDVYLDDRRQSAIAASKMDARMIEVENFCKETFISSKSSEKERRKILGISQNTISIIINLLTIITLVAAVMVIFK